MNKLLSLFFLVILSIHYLHAQSVNDLILQYNKSHCDGWYYNDIEHKNANEGAVVASKVPNGYSFAEGRYSLKSPVVNLLAYSKIRVSFDWELFNYPTRPMTEYFKRQYPTVEIYDSETNDLLLSKRVETIKNEFTRVSFNMDFLYYNDCYFVFTNKEGHRNSEMIVINNIEVYSELLSSMGDIEDKSINVIGKAGSVLLNNVPVSSKIEIFGILGNKVYESESDGNVKVDLPTGAYIVRVNGESQKVVVR